MNPNTSASIMKLGSLIQGLKGQISGIMEHSSSIIKQMDQHKTEIVNYFDTKIEQMRTEMLKYVKGICEKINILQNRINILENRPTCEHLDKNEHESEPVIVMKNLPKTSDAMDSDKVCNVFSELACDNPILVTPSDVKRLPTKNGNPGIVLVTLKSNNDKTRLLKAKAKLKKFQEFNNVHLEQKKSREQLESEYAIRNMHRLGKLGPRYNNRNQDASAIT